MGLRVLMTLETGESRECMVIGSCDGAKMRVESTV